MNKFIPIYVIILSVFIGIVSFDLFSDGMFFDGVFYANFSKVMGLNYSGFWKLKDCIDCELLYGHPPLAIYLNSLLFMFFGDSIYIERLYSLSTYVFSAGFIHLIIKEILPKYKYLSWFSLFFWIITPLVTWGASNNMLENTMTIFVLASVLFSLKSLKNKRVFNIFMASIFIFLAFLSKGVVGLFPLVIFLLLFVTHKKVSIGTILKNSTMLFGGVLFFFILIFFFSENGTTYLVKYFEAQLINGMQNEHTVSYRANIVVKLFYELIPILLFTIIGYVLISKKQRSTYSKEKKWSLFFLLLGLSGVLPIMISLKQASFYIIPSLPFFAISFSILLFPTLKEWINTKVIPFYNKKLILLSLILFLISICMSIVQIGKTGRDKEIIQDVYLIVNMLEKEKTISIPHELFWDWRLKSYFFRYGGVSLSSNHLLLNTYLIIEKNKKDEILNNYNLLSSDLLKYNIYQLKQKCN